MGLEQIAGARRLAQVMGAVADGTAGSPGNLSQGEMADRGYRGLVLGFGPQNVATVTNVSINAQPSLTVRASRLQVNAAIASFFSITDFRIGRNTQLLSNNAVPAAAFSETAVDSGIRGDTCTIGQQIALSVTNLSGAQLQFQGTLFGVAHDG